MAVFDYGAKEPRYEGGVIYTYERYGSSESDWYAVCWDEGSKSVIEVLYDTTRFAGGGTAEVDATEKTLRNVYRFYKQKCKKMFDHCINISQAKAVNKGDRVVVVRGRKVPKGTTGKVFWIGTRQNFYTHREEDRVGIELDDGSREFLPLNYVEVADWESRLMHGKERKRMIVRLTLKKMPSYALKQFERAGA